MEGITTGSDNVFIGKNAGYTIDDGSSNVVIGDDADVSATNSSNQIGTKNLINAINLHSKKRVWFFS